MMKKDLRATWPQALLTLLAPILFIFTLRWAVIEPFIIPSGSMIPTLLVHDHIMVNKLSFGLHIPFSKKWLWQWSRPEQGDMVVFRYPQNPDVFYVKRAVALGGDEISMQQGRLYINGQPLQYELLDSSDDEFVYLQEDDHVVRYQNLEDAFYQPTKVPEGHIFAMGDNRDQSNDSRFWGFVPEENLVGRPLLIWMSCDQMLAKAQFLCDPTSIRWGRVLNLVR